MFAEKQAQRITAVSAFALLLVLAVAVSAQTSTGLAQANIQPANAPQDYSEAIAKVSPELMQQAAEKAPEAFANIQMPQNATGFPEQPAAGQTQENAISMPENPNGMPQAVKAIFTAKDGEDLQAIAQKIRELGGTVKQEFKIGNSLVAEIPADRLLEAASQEEVSSVWDDFSYFGAHVNQKMVNFRHRTKLQNSRQIA
ncbi:MAG: hypothetical protein HY394_05315 [Candidatus Diapherotrites archaeon]|nr:hypothetical protein [Candidatus Diapherotrites archaeon]